MYKVYYNPDTLNIIGYSTETDAFELPFVETELEPLLLWNYKIVDGKLEVIKASFTEEEWKKIIETGHL